MLFCTHQTSDFYNLILCLNINKLILYDVPLSNNKKQKIHALTSICNNIHINFIHISTTYIQNGYNFKNIALQYTPHSYEQTLDVPNIALRQQDMALGTPAQPLV